MYNNIISIESLSYLVFFQAYWGCTLHLQES